MNISEETIEYGIEVFGNKEELDKWLTSEIPSLGHRKPIDCSDEEVMTVLGRIDWGVY